VHSQRRPPIIDLHATAQNHRSWPCVAKVGSHHSAAGQAQRGQRVLLDVELADLYGVATKALLQAVRRNRERFPEDFMIQVTDAEWAILRSQTVTSSALHGGRRYPPYVFTEQGVAMLSSVLRSRAAIAVNVQIMRAFVRMRELLASNTALARKLDELERKYQHHDEAIKAILSAIRELMTPTVPKHRPIGFTADLGADK
jgi:hypothetical protein